MRARWVVAWNVWQSYAAVASGGYRCIVGFAVIRTAMGLCLGVIRRHANQVGGILPVTSVHCGREGDSCPAGRGRLLRPLRPRAVIGRYFESSSRSEFEGQHARHADSSSRDTSSQFPSRQENGLELSAPTMQASSLASSSKIGSSHGSLGRPFSPLGLSACRARVERIV